MAKSEFLKLFKERGYHHQCTNIDGLDELMSSSNVTAYIGFDCTASSLHVGNLVQIMILRLLQRTGHTPIILFGGGTTKVGDPSFKDESRKMLSFDVIKQNMQGIQNSISKFINFNDSSNKAIVVDNADWLDHINYMEFLRDYGRHFSVNRMLSFDSVKLRLEREQNLSFLEFNYMILQAYDFVELYRKYNCRLQIGGSDQWGNIVNGVDLGRKNGTEEIFGLTTPLLTTASGAKMGKTVSGAVWLNEDLLPPFEYFQYWRNTEDADVARFLRLFTELPEDEIAKLAKLQGSEINEAKKILAFEATKLCHGEENAKACLDTAKKLFEQNSVGGAMNTIEISKSQLEQGIMAFELFHLAKLCASNSEAKRLIKGKGAKINDITLENEGEKITVSNITDGVIKLSAGRKNHALIKVIS